MHSSSAGCTNTHDENKNCETTSANQINNNNNNNFNQPNILGIQSNTALSNSWAINPASVNGKSTNSTEA